MKRLLLFVTAGFLIFGAAMMLSKRHVSCTDTAVLQSYYGAVVDRVIAECRERSRLRNGRIERAPVINGLKAAYFQLRRERLIGELVVQKIGKNEFLARYHLNRRFYADIRAPGS